MVQCMASFVKTRMQLWLCNGGDMVIWCRGKKWSKCFEGFEFFENDVFEQITFSAGKHKTIKPLNVFTLALRSAIGWQLSCDYQLLAGNFFYKIDPMQSRWLVARDRRMRSTSHFWQRRPKNTPWDNFLDDNSFLWHRNTTKTKRSIWNKKDDIDKYFDIQK